MYSRTQCPSVLTTDNKEHIIQIKGVHNHVPPEIEQTPTGFIHQHHKKKPGRKPKREAESVPKLNEMVDVEILP